MRFTLAALVLAALAACASKEPPPASPAPNPPNAASPANPDRPTRSARVVNATILANACKDLGRTHGNLAEKAMYELVEGCSSVPGGSAQFGATLQPGGRIDIAAAPGQPDVVPICVLKHRLAHKVPLVKPCRLDVKIEETSVPVGVDAGP